MRDYIVRATAAEGQIRAFAMTSREIVETARSRHDTSPVVTAALGRLLTAGAMMGIMMKGEKDLLTLQIRCSGPVKGLTVTADSYDTYSKKLYVNSKEATIVIGMTGQSTASGSDTSKTESSDDADTTTDTAQAGSLAGSLAGSHSAGSTGSTGGTGTSNSVSNATGEAELNAIVDGLLEEKDENETSDYLSTIVEALLKLKDN